MDKEVLTRLIKKFLAGQCTPAEEQTLEQWWQNSLGDDRYINGLSESEREMLSRKMFSNIQHLIHKHDARSRAMLIPWNTFTKLMAAACLIFAVAAFVFLLSPEKGDIIISSEYGERLEVLLPDQSTVVLNGNSSLRYARWEAGQDRTVWLKGEAFFSVKHTENHNRFIVYTPDSLRIEVLGTQFTVDNRKGITNVVLCEGEVKLEKASYTYVMKPNEMVSYSKASREFVKRTVDAGQEVAWKDNILIFRDETLRAIAEKLEESHGLTIIFKNEAIEKEIFHGSVPGDDVEVLFEKIEKLYGVKVTKDEDGTHIIE